MVGEVVTLKLESYIKVDHDFSFKPNLVLDYEVSAKVDFTQYLQIGSALKFQKHDCMQKC